MRSAASGGRRTSRSRRSFCRRRTQVRFQEVLKGHTRVHTRLCNLRVFDQGTGHALGHLGLVSRPKGALRDACHLHVIETHILRDSEASPLPGADNGDSAQMGGLLGLAPDVARLVVACLHLADRVALAQTCKKLRTFCLKAEWPAVDDKSRTWLPESTTPRARAILGYVSCRRCDACVFR